MYPNNFYYPYNTFYQMPYKMPNANIFSRITRSVNSINWSNLLNNTSKTLGVINQAIPIVKQTGPMIHNMRSMLKVAKAFKNETSNNNIENNTQKKQDNNTSPKFFL